MSKRKNKLNKLVKGKYTTIDGKVYEWTGGNHYKYLFDADDMLARWNLLIEESGAKRGTIQDMLDL